MFTLDEVNRLKEENEKLTQQVADLSKRENGLLMRLSAKEEEIHELQVKINFHYFQKRTKKKKYSIHQTTIIYLN